MIYKKENTREISFPLGGIGSGSIGLGGNGRLLDWEIFNRPAKGRMNAYSHFAMRAEKKGKVIDARILNGNLEAPYTGLYTATLGSGPDAKTFCGLPHFSEHTFKGEYPFAWIDFKDKAFPGKVELCAWSPFIPGNDYDSSIPLACFEVHITNNTEDTLDYTAIAALSNPCDSQSALNTHKENHGVHQLFMRSKEAPENEQDFSYGDIALSCDSPKQSWQEYWYRGAWSDELEVYWHDLNQPGYLKNRFYKSREASFNKSDTGMLAAHFKLAPGKSCSARFCITWNIPLRRNYWTADIDKKLAEKGLPNCWKNWYATQWKNSSASGLYALKNYKKNYDATKLFHDSLFESSLPDSVLDGISANMSILKTPTCIRYEDGTFWGWEGISATEGSCYGSCTHVWNYAQALPFLFPVLERSMRESHYKYSIDDAGGAHFRVDLPFREGAQVNRPCVDGQFGDVMKAYRDWKISGDSGWLLNLWPVIKRTMEYAWSEKNYDRWDPDKSGVIAGRQHHTLDMELFGANAWLNGHYLGALKAASEMADFAGDKEFAKLCMDIFVRGRKWMDKNLFNGDYYCQKLDLEDKSIVDKFKAESAYWDKEHGQIKYQIGEGCEIDMHLPQWYASLYGIGEIMDTLKVRKTLQSIYKNNFKDPISSTANTWRVFALNDESGVMICTWPKGHRKPVIPITYASETMHGFEWAFASNLIMNGFIKEGLKVVKSIRGRYDGKRRNPWNEFECGNNYARSMASYSLLNAFSGFSFDMTKGMIGFKPVQNKREFDYFWSLGNVWGNIVKKDKKIYINVKYGKLELKFLSFDFKVDKISLARKNVDFIREGSLLKFNELIKVEELIPLLIELK